MWKLAGWSGVKPPAQNGKFVGTVSKLLPNGSAFVTCPDVVSTHGYEAFVNPNTMKVCSLAQGEVVAFNIHLVAGKPQMLAPCWKRSMTAAAEAAAAAASAVNARAGSDIAEHDSWTESAPASAQTVYIGVVKLSNVAKGISSVVCPEGGFQTDILVDRDVADPRLLSAHDVVAFKVAIDTAGTPRASPPLWKLLGWNGKDPPKLGEYVGHVRAPLTDGTVCVDCPDATSAHKSEPRIHDKVMAFCGLTTGDTIAFSIQPDASRTPNVPAPCWKCCTEDPNKQAAASASVQPEVAGTKPVGQAVMLPARVQAESWTPSAASAATGARASPLDPRLKPGLLPSKVAVVPAVAKAAGIPAAAKVGASQAQRPVEEAAPAAKASQFVVMAASTAAPAASPTVVPAPSSSAAEAASSATAAALKVAAQAHAAEAGIDSIAKANAGSCLATSAIEPAAAGAQKSAKLASAAPSIAPAAAASTPAAVAGASEGSKVQAVRPPQEQATKAAIPKSKDVHLGIVKVADEMIGVSTVSCANSGFDHDVRIPNSIADPEILSENDFVAFSVDVDARGKAKAVAPFWKLVGRRGQERPGTFANFLGKISRAISRTMALIECPEVVSVHGVAAHISEGVMDTCMLDFGDTIAFTLRTGEGGKLEVAAPIWRCCTAPGLNAEDADELAQKAAVAADRVEVTAGKKRAATPLGLVLEADSKRSRTF
mmetsp:Transcript_105915/g.298383  ORF Transcript_105915/g.298383 Transcript_105915/m.298383 type:complete len:712 (-) Transcript_105915:526-2661(-)